MANEKKAKAAKPKTYSREELVSGAKAVFEHKSHKQTAKLLAREGNGHYYKIEAQKHANDIANTLANKKIHVISREEALVEPKAPATPKANANFLNKAKTEPEGENANS